MGWVFGLTELDGTPIGRFHWALERKLDIPLNGLPTASFRLRLDDPMADAITSREGDCLLKVYDDSALQFIGDLTDAEELGAGGFYRRVFDRKGLVNIAYVLPPSFEAGTTPGAEVASATDTVSIAARGQYEEVIPSDVQDFQLRQALASAHVAVRAVPRQIITFDPSAKDDSEGSLAVNAAGPFWRLQKRLLGSPYPSAARSWVSTPANQIIDAMINQTNTNSDSGIRLGTRDTLYTTSIGSDPDEPSLVYKPVAEGITDLQAAKIPFPVATPPTAVAQDAFNQTAGDLNAKVDDLANTWATSGSTGDFQVYNSGGQHHVNRQDVSNASPRVALSGVANQSDVLVGCDWLSSSAGAAGDFLLAGVFARYVDANNWLLAYIDLNLNKIGVDMKTTAGGQVNLGLYSFPSGGFAADTYYTIRLLVDAYGTFTVWHYQTSVGLDAPKLHGQSDTLRTGGTLATGKVGIYDQVTTAGAIGRNYDNFVASAYPGPQSFDFQINPVEPTADASGYPGTLPYIGTLDIRAQIGASKPEVIFEPGRAPVFGTDHDYVVGDYVTGRARKPDGTASFNALFRVYGVEISIDEEGKETVIPKLVPE